MTSCVPTTTMNQNNIEQYIFLFLCYLSTITVGFVYTRVDFCSKHI